MKLGMYGVGQGLAYVLDMTLFVIIISLNPNSPVVFVNVVTKFASAMFAFEYHRNISFKRMQRERSTADAERSRFFLVVLTNMAITSTLIGSLSYIFPIYSAFTKLGADVLGFVLTYALLRYFVFSDVDR